MVPFQHWLGALVVLAAIAVVASALGDEPQCHQINTTGEAAVEI